LELLGDPPLKRTCAIFGLARAIHVAGYVTGRGLPQDGFPSFIRDAIARAFVASGAAVDDPNTIDLGSAVAMMGAARFAVEKIRKQAKQRAPKVGRQMDLVLHAFIRGVQFAREPEQVSGEEIALLAAASGFEPIEVGCMAEATKKWSMRLSRLGKLGPVSAPPPGAPPLKTS
jgi:hypothetical protein